MNLERKRLLEATEAGDTLAKAAIEAIYFINLYSNRDEAPLYALREAVCKWLNLSCDHDTLRDGRAWEVFIRPHMRRVS